ncbi:hypothetical protein [Streptomyces sp. NBC_00687]|uniref:hypothetical protein n=1 Tax=Streptomyces sp. NBC_00687 TaxID=2975807 RepID=UPI00225720A3|nr:hypothetical protein [Streptomyces sp. NBC_00687]MCX4920221.1 hypothetical protein [Streptomyces sp. NBC_00687]
MNDRDDDVVPFAALLGGYWLEPAFDDDRDVADAVGRDRVTGLLKFPNSRTAMVLFAAVTVVAAVITLLA